MGVAMKVNNHTHYQIFGAGFRVQMRLVKPYIYLCGVAA